jgi:hypothetical protein
MTDEFDNSGFDALSAYIEAHTPPDKESWDVLPIGDQIHVMALEQKAGIKIKYGKFSLTKFKSGVVLTRRDLGCVILRICPDNLEAASELSIWLTRQAKSKFNFLPYRSSSSTSQILRDWHAAMEPLQPGRVH